MKNNNPSSQNFTNFPQVRCVKSPTPAPSWKTFTRLVVALVIVYFMISAWDDVLDETLRRLFGFTNNEGIMGKLVRALVATIIALTALKLVHIDIDDLMGAFID